MSEVCGRGRGRVVSYRHLLLLSQPHSSMPKDSVSLIGMGPVEYNTPGDMKLLVRFRQSPTHVGVEAVVYHERRDTSPMSRSDSLITVSWSVQCWVA
jgi:hypothetical protein